MGPFDRPDSTSSGGGWTQQHQVAIDALGIASAKNSEESLFRQAEEDIPTTEPNDRGFSSGAAKFRSSHLCSPVELLPTYTHRVRIAIPEIDGVLEIPVLVPQT